MPATTDKTPKTTKSGAARKPRTPSPFDPAVRVTVAYHVKLLEAGYDPKSPASIIGAYLDNDDNVTVRVVQRSRKTRKDGKPVSGPVSQMVYVAPKGYTFPSERTGLSINQETRSKLQTLAAQTGMSLDALVDALIAQAAKTETTEPAS